MSQSLFQLFILALTIGCTITLPSRPSYQLYSSSSSSSPASLRRSASNSAASSLSSSSSYSAGAAKLVISPDVAHIRRPVKKAFVLTCRGEGDNPSLFTDLKWYDSMGREITSRHLASSLRVSGRNSSTGYYMGNKISVRQEGEKLLLSFRDPDINDGGEYTCRGKFQVSVPLSVSVRVSFYQDVKFENCLTSQALVKGKGDGFISCSVSASPPPIISWTRDSMPLGENRYIIENNGIRVRGAVEESDAGLYEVSARVEETGEVLYQVITVEVYVSPRIENIHHDEDAIEGQSVTLTCRAEGVPKPLITWFDPSMKNLSEVGGYIVDRERGVLTILKVQRFNDQGFFTCRAENAAGFTQETHEMTVLIKPNIVSFENITARAGGQAVFECRASGQPKPEISIRKDREGLPLITGIDDVTIVNSTTADESILIATINRLSRRHSDLYYCTAVNKGGRDERTGHLTVEFMPDLSRTKTIVKTWESNPVNITCHADAIPNATISWFRHNARIYDPSSSTYAIYHENGMSHLQIKPLALRGGGGGNVYGIYRCEAENVVGKSFVDINLEQAYAPDVPGQVKIIRTTPTMVEYELSPPARDGGLPVRKYHVRYRKEHYDENKEASWPASSGVISSFKLESLEPRASYLLRFAAQNDVGLGPWSSEQRIVMPYESMPEKPEFILPDPLLSPESGEVTSASPYEYLVQWKKPNANGREIDQYRIRFYKVARSETGWAQISKSREEFVREHLDNLYHKITSLTPNSYYRIEMNAHNAIGSSETSFLVIQTPSDLNSLASHKSASPSSSIFSSLVLLLATTIALLLSPSTT